MLRIGSQWNISPVMPTNPFLLVAKACYYESSPRMHKWLPNNKWFVEYIKNYQEGEGLTVETKITTLTVLWITIGLSSFFMLKLILPPQLILPIKAIMATVTIVVCIYITRLPTLKKISADK